MFRYPNVYRLGSDGVGMSALTSALPSSSWVAECETSARQPVIMRVARGAMLGCLLSLAFVIEYEQAGSMASKNLLYDTLASGFRIIDLLVLGLAIVYGFSLGCLRKRSRRFPPTLIALLTAFAGAIVVSLVSESSAEARISSSTGEPSRWA